MTEFCRTCEHNEDEHDSHLGFCTVPHCRCPQFVSDTDEELDELNFDEDGA